MLDNSTAVSNFTKSLPEEFLLNRDPLHIVVPLTVIYTVIFITGIVGNSITCVVISRNKHMHTATNYYLFSLAISDILLLVSGLPAETFGLWSKHQFLSSEALCLAKGFIAETSSNATVLTITAFTVERYLAICHPFRSFSLSKLSRAVLLVLIIWIISGVLAIPMAIQFGINYERIKEDFVASYCSVKTLMIKAFVVSSFVVFVLPMTVITVLYILIALKLKMSGRMRSKRPSVSSDGGATRTTKAAAHQQHVIKMLVAVVVAFFICWAPFHAQRLFALHMKELHAKGQLEGQQTLLILYDSLLHISGILYFLSTTVNPLLYNIMSLKFRLAFKSTLSKTCCRRGASRNLDTSRGIVRLNSHKFGNGSNPSTKTSILLTRVKRIPVRAGSKQGDDSNPANLEVAYETHVNFEKATNLNANPTPSQENSDGRRNKSETSLRSITRKIRSLPGTQIFCNKRSFEKDTVVRNDLGSPNNISNSSLLDLDPSEFTSSELAGIIGQMKTEGEK